MSFNPKKLAQFQAAVAETTQYTVGTGKTTILKQILLCNTTTQGATISLSVVTSGGTAGDSNRLLKTALIGGNVTVDVDTTIPMAAGDFISTASGTANAITVTILGVDSP